MKVHIKCKKAPTVEDALRIVVQRVVSKYRERYCDTRTAKLPFHQRALRQACLASLKLYQKRKLWTCYQVKNQSHIVQVDCGGLRVWNVRLIRVLL